MKTAVEVTVILLVLLGISQLTHQPLVWLGAVLALYALWRNTHPEPESEEVSPDRDEVSDEWNYVPMEDWDSEFRDDSGPRDE